MTAPACMHSTRGFSLVEVMVALVIVAVALPALLVQVMSMTDGTAALRDKTIAGWVADNTYQTLVLQQRQQGQRLSGHSRGTTSMAGVEWHWRVRGEATVVPHLQRLWIEVGARPDQTVILAERYLQYD